MSVFNRETHSSYFLQYKKQAFTFSKTVKPQNIIQLLVTEIWMKGYSLPRSLKPYRPLPWLTWKSVLSVQKLMEYFYCDKLCTVWTVFLKYSPLQKVCLAVTYISIHKPRLLLSACKYKKHFKSLYLEIWKKPGPKSVSKFEHFFDKSCVKSIKKDRIHPS